MIIDKAAKRNETIENSWFQLDLYPLKLTNQVINTPQNKQTIKAGLLIDSQSFIEIKAPNKKKQKILVQPLFNEESLFPLFKTYTVNNEPKLSEKGIMISVFETAVGLIKQHKIKATEFDPDLLHFEFKALPDYSKTILSDIVYDRISLVSVKDDCLITEQQVYFK